MSHYVAGCLWEAQRCLKSKQQRFCQTQYRPCIKVIKQAKAISVLLYTPGPAMECMHPTPARHNTYSSSHRSMSLVHMKRDHSKHIHTGLRLRGSTCLGPVLGNMTGISVGHAATRAAVRAQSVVTFSWVESSSCADGDSFCTCQTNGRGFVCSMPQCCTTSS